jgi:hypothetical protein
MLARRVRRPQVGLSATLEVEADVTAENEAYGKNDSPRKYLAESR